MRLIPRIVLCVVLLSGSLPAASPDPSTHRLSTVELDDVTMERAEKIIIPRFEIKDLTPAEALEAIRKKIREVSPSEELKFEEKYEPIRTDGSQPPSPALPGLEPSSVTHPAAALKITVALANVPVSDILRYVVGLSYGRLEVPRGAAFLAKLTTRRLPFVFNDPALCEELGINADVAAEIRRDVKQYLEKRENEFHPGTSCRIDADGRSLVVKHTPEDLDNIQNALESVIPAGSPGPEVPKVEDATAPMQKRAGKLILGEVNLTDVTLLEATDRLTELSRQWDVNEPSPEKRGIKVDVEHRDFIPELESGSIPGLESGTAERGPLSKHKVRYVGKNVSLLEVVQELAKQVGAMVVLERGWINIVEPSRIEFRKKPDEFLLLTKEYITPGPSFRFEGPLVDSDPLLYLLATTGRRDIGSGRGPNAIYLPGSSRFIVCHTESNHQKVATMVEKAWRDYYASDEWTKEQKRRKQLRELGLYRETRLERLFAE